VTDPLNKTTSYQYDALNQLRQIDQPGPTITQYDDYDSQGNLKTVTDATLKSTGYEYDDMGRVLKANSPDAGIISYVYDPVNNRMYSTDTNGLTSTYSFDDIGRLTGVSFSDGSPTETVGYDANTYGMGRLTAFTDSAGGTEFSYNSLGQLVQETRTNSGMTALSMVYGYNSTNADLDNITYPSGLVVSYGRDSNGRINAILADSTPLIGSISYMPFGPAEDYDMIAGGAVLLHVDRTFNERYLPTRIQAGTVMDYQYKYYADGSVWKISGVPTTTVNQEVTDSYQVSGTNQLDYSVTDTNPPVQYGYDANGNTISDGSKTFAYDRHNRLVSITQGTETLAEYAYDFQGRRVKKTVGGMATSYVYDANNNLIAETDGNGTPLRDYIYLGSAPVAMKVYGAQAGIYYFINDHLGTPQKIVDSTGTMVWEAAYLPFGQAQVLVATIDNNLRFPGQYFDAETGLHYNWHRYYDPATGRYLTPDPIGLEGGMNLYSYSYQNPVNYVDPFGLAPGDLFKSIDDAAIDAIGYSMPKSEKAGREYGGYIYETPDGMYSYAPPVQGDKTGMNTSDFECVPEKTEKEGIYHTHPGDSKMAPYFSPFDYITSGLQGVPIYLGTNKGTIKKHTPGIGDKTLRY
jgi:RHS repeat-associated protein